MPNLMTLKIALLSGTVVAGIFAHPTFADAEKTSETIEEIVVTATRTEQQISKVPLSISAYTQQMMDMQGAKTIADVAAFTPGVTFTGSGGTFGANNNVTVRGIVNTAGAGTTGIYIDDTPIQVYAVGAFMSDVTPDLFDLDRVEVLRGPQGTLFGAGSMGGTVRYITTQPNLEKYSVYARGEQSFTDGGAPSSEVGLAVGGPIIDGKLGFRVSGYFQQDGGWIDRVDRNTGTVEEKNANWGNSYALRLALTWAPVDGLEITPAVLYQDRYLNSGYGYPNSGPNASWEAFSDPSEGIFKNANRIPTPMGDHSTLSNVGIKYDFGGPLLISNTSYYWRNGNSTNDGSVFDASLFGLTTPTGPAVPGVADWNSYDSVQTTQNTLSQEVRLQSDAAGRFRWLVGGFYSRNRQFNLETFHAPDLPLLTENVFGATVDEVFGVNLLPPDIGYVGSLNSEDSQLAAFGEVNYDVLKELTLTVGLRKSQLKYNFDTQRDGPYNGGPTSGTGNTSENPLTPKYSVSYRPTDSDLIYATAAKGFRTGGANLPVPAELCAADLATLGLETPPSTYKSDGLWSYEVGAKDKFFGNRLEISSSVYRIDWTQIQQKVPLLNCGFSLITNLGSARSQGFDVQAQVHPFENFTAGVALGYDEAKFTETVRLSGNVNLVTEGDRLPVSPWTATVTADYKWRVAERDAYLHVEDRYGSKYSNLIAQNSANTSYDPAAYPRPDTNVLLMRAGILLNNLDCAIFANNVLNSHTTIARSHDTVSSPTFFLQNIQPRMIGITFTYRK